MSTEKIQGRRLFLLDLDGTLIDSRADLARSVNLTLARLGLREIDLAAVTRFVGDGARMLIERALRESAGTEPPADQLDGAIPVFLEEYGRHLLDQTLLYPGAREAIESMPWARWAIVTNKPERLSAAILEGLGLAPGFSAVIGGDSLPPFRKPDPEPLIEAMRRCGASAGETVMVGDSPVDVQAGRAAGVLTVAVTGGYRNRSELESERPDILTDSIASLPDLFRT
jgi:phosphoglycolate phosphatase